MGFFNKYPYTDFHEMNLNFVVDEATKMRGVREETEKNLENIVKTSEDAVRDISATANNLMAKADGVLTQAKVSADNSADSAEQAKSALHDTHVFRDEVGEMVGVAVQASGDAETARDIAIAQVESIEDTAEQIALLQSRVDNIIPDGTQTEGNTELIDIRVDYLGRTFASAGDAVRDQIVHLHEDVDECVKTVNNTAPDEDGNVNIPTTYDDSEVRRLINERVKTVNGIAPDENGNVNVQGGEGAVSDIILDGASLVDPYTHIAYLYKASSNTLGLVKGTTSNGVYVDSTGTLKLVKANTTYIKNRSSNVVMMTDNINDVVKASLCDAKRISLTDNEKNTALYTLGANWESIPVDDMLTTKNGALITSASIIVNKALGIGYMNLYLNLANVDIPSLFGNVDIVSFKKNHPITSTVDRESFFAINGQNTITLLPIDGVGTVRIQRITGAQTSGTKYTGIFQSCDFFFFFSPSD